MFPGVTVILEEGVHVGHGASVHGAHIGANTLIGMNAVIMDNVKIGQGCIIGALTLVKADEVIPDRMVVAGNPGKIVKPVTDEMLEWKTAGTAVYQKLPTDMRRGWELCEPLTEIPQGFQELQKTYKTWNETKPGIIE